MPTSYPGALDAFTNPNSGDALTSPSHASQHGNVNDAIEAIETSAGRGVLGYAAATTNQAGITTAVDLTGLSVAVTVAASRRVRITGSVGLFLSTVGSDSVGLNIFEGAAQLAGGVFLLTPTAGNYQAAMFQVILSPTAAAHTYKLKAVRQHGTGSLTLAASATNPAFILVEDIGAA